MFINLYNKWSVPIATGGTDHKNYKIKLTRRDFRGTLSFPMDYL